MSLYDNLDAPSALPVLTSTPPVGEAGQLLASLPPTVTGSHLMRLRKASGMAPSKFASLLGVSPEWLRLFESGKPAVLSQCRPTLQLGVAQGVRQLGVKLTEDGWKLINGDGG
jgi:hypothetical protein